MMKNIHTLIFSFLIAAQCAFGQELMPLDEIKPGMAGIAKTVFSGYKPEDFPIEVVEVWRNFQPKRNLILIQLKGKKAVHTGVAAGMSGSPVYIDGKLAGALAYSIGVFMKDPLAGVTPIEEMMKIFDREASREQELARYSASGDHKFLEMALGFESLAWENFVPHSLIQQRAGLSGTIRPLQLPLALAGIHSGLVEKIGELIGEAGFIATGAGSIFDHRIDGDDLVPGSAIGAVLVSGDASIAAVGTVTHREGNKVLAFGHPFFNTGPVDMPISLAKILTVAPSEFNAFKLGASSTLLGSLRQDRQTGIYGEVGTVPAMIPLKVTYTDEGGNDEAFHFNFTDERSINTLVPLFLRVILVNALQSARLATGENSLRLNGSVQLENGETIKLENFYPGMMPIRGAGMLNSILQSTGEIAATLGAVMANNFQPAKLTAVDLQFTSIPGRRSATIEQVWLDKTSAEPGDTLTVFARLKNYQGPQHIVQQKLIVPRSIKGRTLSVVVSGGQDLMRYEKQMMTSKFIAQSYEQLISILNQRRKNDSLYFQLRTFDQGLVVEGNELSSLPPTAYAVLKSRNMKGNTSRARDRVLTEAAQKISAPQQSNSHNKNSQAMAIFGRKIIRVRLFN